MNREIKFRIWNGHAKAMYPSEHFAIRLSDGKLLQAMEHNERTDEPTTFESAFKDELIVLMQFTGLKDKNGKEVWEGDIVKLDAENGKIWEVYWANSEWYLCNKEKLYDNGDYYHGDDIFWEGVEVIGNIYENPELL